MNKLEAKYADLLHMRLLAGEIAAYWFESMRLKIGHDSWYTTDFKVQLVDGVIELHECKGFLRDDAAVKLKAVAAMYPYPVKLVKWTLKDGWDIEEIKAA